MDIEKKRKLYQNIAKVCLVGGAMFLAFSSIMMTTVKGDLDEAKASVNWPTTSGVITESKVVHDKWSDGSKRVYADLLYEYEVAGKQRKGNMLVYGRLRDESGKPMTDQAIVKAWPVGKQVTVYYDNGISRDSVLIPGDKYQSKDIFYISIGFICIACIVILSGITLLILAFTTKHKLQHAGVLLSSNLKMATPWGAGSHRLENLTDGTLEYRSTTWGKGTLAGLLAVALLEVGVLAWLAQLWIQSSGSLGGVMIILTLAILFQIGSSLIIALKHGLNMKRKRVFDPQKGIFWEGSRLPFLSQASTANGFTDPKAINLQLVQSFQIVKKKYFVRSSVGGYEGASNTSVWELNLVFGENQRVHLCDYNSADQATTDSNMFANWLGVPVINATAPS